LWPGGWRAGEPEITQEANPTSIEAPKFAAFRGAGVNRVSVGIQALDDAALRFLGREHSAAEALDALAVAQKTFTRVNADMIYARPGQSEAAWAAELGRLLAEGLGHLALYQLTIERGTPFFAAHRRGDFALPGAEAEAGLYELTGEILGRAGLSAYEVSNYAKPGEECRHNLTYWRYGDFAGIGPGAHGRLTLADGMVATEALRRPEDWIEAVRRLGSGERARAPVSLRERAEEMVMMGLRIGEGVDEARFREVTGGGFADHLDARGLERLIAAGYLEAAGRRLAATEAGRMRLNAVIAELFPEADAP
jgi:oxygen-independent coproporphyrinogen-3 oxidase